MRFLNSGNVIRIPLDDIVIEGRLRAIRPSFVENLIVMAEDTGITTPIHVRKVQGQYVLIDGAHRVAASRRMNLADIAALVVECRADEARAMEATNNLGAARMTPLQTAVFVASWKRDYYAMHPERKPGVFKGNQHTGNVVEGILPLTKTMADAFGVDESTVKRAMLAGERLTSEEVAQLEAAPGRVTMQDLKGLAKIREPGERSAVVRALAEGSAKSASEALRGLKAPAAAAVKDPVDVAFKGLLAAWHRAPMAARRRLVDELAPVLREMLAAEGTA